VALSSTEVEYIAVTMAACHIIWLRRILSDLKEPQEEPTELFCDNKSTIAVTKNPVHQGRTKHIEMRHHFIRELIAKNEVEMNYCSTEDQLADIFTKALGCEKFLKLRSMLGIQGKASVELRGAYVGS
jgi:hypothetical protein